MCVCVCVSVYMYVYSIILYCISLFPPYIEDYKSFNREKLNHRNQIIKEKSTIFTCEHPICDRFFTCVYFHLNYSRVLNSLYFSV